jgi:hypothetical protein
MLEPGGQRRAVTQTRDAAGLHLTRATLSSREPGGHHIRETLDQSAAGLPSRCVPLKKSEPGGQPANGTRLKDARRALTLKVKYGQD